MPNIYNPNFNQNVVEVYTEEPGYTGFKGLDFTKIDSIESILESGTNAALSGSNVFLSRISENASGLNNKVFATGDAAPGGVQGTIVFQADLTAQYDNVDVAGYAGADISGLNAAVSNNFPVYTSIQLFYDGSNNNTGVFYKSNGATNRIIQMGYDGSNNLTGVVKIDY